MFRMKFFLSCFSSFFFVFANFADANDLKYVFLFIGDGMGDVLIDATERLSAEKLSFTRFPVIGRQKTSSADKKITDSAAAATAIACGVKTNNGMLGITPDGRRLESIAIVAQKNGWKVGILTSVSLDHATPAGFYAQEESRKNISKIAYQLVNAPFDFFAGGGLEGQLNPDNSEDNFQIAIRNGFKIVRSREDLEAVKKNEKVIAINHRTAWGVSLPWGLDLKDDDIRLSEFTDAAIKHLEDSRFFIIVEGGKIDWACHSNDLATAVGEMLQFEMAVRVALEFFKKKPENTLIIVTSDHETGGIQILENFKPSKILLPKMSGDELTDAIKKIQNENSDITKLITFIKNEYGMENITLKEEKELKIAWEDTLNGGERETPYRKTLPIAFVLWQIFASKTGFKFTSEDHTQIDVPVYAMGVGSENFSGNYENTEIFHKLYSLMRLKNAKEE